MAVNFKPGIAVVETFGPPRFEYPENPDDFMQAVHDDLLNNFINQAITTRVLDAIKHEVYQRYWTANDVYRLGIRNVHEFWTVEVEAAYKNIHVRVFPTSLGCRPKITRAEYGFFAATLGHDSAVGRTRLEAIVELGKMRGRKDND